MLAMSLKGLGAKTKWLAVNRQSLSNSDSETDRNPQKKRNSCALRYEYPKTTTWSRRKKNETDGIMNYSIVTWGLKARIVEPEKTSVSRQWLYKHVSAVTNLRDRSNRYRRNNREIVVGSVLCWVCAGAIYRCRKRERPSVCIRYNLNPSETHYSGLVTAETHIGTYRLSR
jgi:hypothetical protein